jgi:hypothetical protein
MPRALLPFTNGFYVAQSLPLSAQQCINAYPVAAEAGGLQPEALYGTPGIAPFASQSSGAPAQACRGLIVLNGELLAVLGSQLRFIRPIDSPDNLGTISGEGPVYTIINNAGQLLILDPGGDGYIYAGGGIGTVQEITDPDFRANGNPLAACFIDGYFCFTTDQNRIIVSSINDGLSYNALDFGSAEYVPDKLVAPFTFRGQLLIAGEQSIEGFTNTGGLQFPFQRSGLFFDQGVKAPFSIVNTPSAVFFVGSGRNEGVGVWALSGNGTERVSTQAIDYMLGEYSDQQQRQITGWQYAQAGHYFVGFSLPDTTIVFDVTTGKWHERRSRVTSAGNMPTDQRWRATHVVQAYSRLIVGDERDGRLGYLDFDTYTDYGQPIIRSFATMPFQNNMKPFSVPSLELTVESGVGNTSANDPVVRLEISRDGGKTWLPERPRPIGRIGEYNRRAVWRRNGRPNRFDVYRFTHSDPVKFAGLQLTAEIRPGASGG